MAFASFADYRQKVSDAGQYWTGYFRKVPANATTSGIWCDLSMSPGNPVNNFFFSTPLTSGTLNGNEGIYLGSAMTPYKRYLRRITAQSTGAVPVTLQANDILLYYPAIDGDSVDPQTLVNSVALPRYSNGSGVRAYLVSQGSYTGGNQFYLTYTNQDGVAGKHSQICTMNTAGTYGTLASAGVTAGTFGWFIPLAHGDSGMRSVQEITFLSGGGGIFSLVLCFPYGALTILEANVPAEKDFLIDHGLNMPIIEDGAYINFLANPTGSLAAVPITGTAEIVWG